MTFWRRMKNKQEQPQASWMVDYVHLSHGTYVTLLRKPTRTLKCRLTDATACAVALLTIGAIAAAFMLLP